MTLESHKIDIKNLKMYFYYMERLIINIKTICIFLKINFLTLSIVLVSIYTTNNLYAQHTDNKNKKKVFDFKDVNLEALLNETITIATKSKQEISEAPAIVSVISKRKIRDSGARTLIEVLKSVAGLETIRDQTGNWKLSIRGFQSAPAILVMIDNHRINDPFDGTVYYDIPIDSIEHIEIIRGPGSALHGTNAFVGVINVVTIPKTDNFEINTYLDFQPDYQNKVTDFSRPTTGISTKFTKHFNTGKNKSNKFNFNLYAHYIKDDGARLLISEDADSTKTCPSKACSEAYCKDNNGERAVNEKGKPLTYNECIIKGYSWQGHTNDKKQKAAVFLDFQWNDLTLDFKYLGDKRDILLSSPDEQDGILGYKGEKQQKIYLIDLIYSKQITTKLNINSKIYYDEHHVNFLLQQKATGFKGRLGTRDNNYKDIVNNGRLQLLKYISSTLGTEFSIDWNIFKTNSIVGELNLLSGILSELKQIPTAGLLRNYVDQNYYQNELIDSSRELTEPKDDLLQPFVNHQGQYPCKDGELCFYGKKQYVTAFYNQLYWVIDLPWDSVGVQVNSGLRADHYSDFGWTINPKIGTVLSIDDNISNYNKLLEFIVPDNFKILYAHAFRAPTFRDLYNNYTLTFTGNPGLKPETVKTFEVGLGYTPVKNIRGRFNYFYNKIENNIEKVYSKPRDPMSQRNFKTIYGYEIELLTDISKDFYGFLNLSLFNATDKGKVHIQIEGDDIPGFKTMEGEMEDQAKFRFNFGLNLNVYKNLFTNIQGFYSGSRSNLKRTESEKGRPWNIDPYFLINSTITLKQIYNFNINFSIFNLFDTKYEDPISSNQTSDFSISDDNPTNLPMPGRSFGIFISYNPL